MTTWSDDPRGSLPEGDSVEEAADESAVESPDALADDTAVDPADDAGAPSFEQEQTGEPRVDAAVQELAALDEMPTSEHADVYEDVHRRLHSALTELDTE